MTSDDDVVTEEKKRDGSPAGRSNECEVWRQARALGNMQGARVERTRSAQRVKTDETVEIQAVRLVETDSDSSLDEKEMVTQHRISARTKTTNNVVSELQMCGLAIMMQATGADAHNSSVQGPCFLSVVIIVIMFIGFSILLCKLKQRDGMFQHFRQRKIGLRGGGKPRGKKRKQTQQLVLPVATCAGDMNAPVGLENCGNWCFLNAAIQCMLSHQAIQLTVHQPNSNPNPNFNQPSTHHIAFAELMPYLNGLLLRLFSNPD